MWPFALLCVGVAGLLIGADLAIGAGRRIAHRLGVPSLVIGLTLMSIGTSVPEIATNVAVGLRGLQGQEASGLAVGNIVGSCLSQITLLLGIAALLRPVAISPAVLRRDAVAVLLALFLMVGVSVDGRVTRVEAATCLAAYAVYLAVVVRSAGSTGAPDGPNQSSLRVDVIKGFGGLLAVVLAGDLVVDQAVTLAQVLGLPQTAIGLLVGVGTGLPELTVALRAALARDSGLAIGNLLGSNITDPLLSFGAGALVHPLSFTPSELGIDAVFWLIGTLVALLLLWSHKELDRQEGAVLVLVFVLYLAVRALS